MSDNSGKPMAKKKSMDLGNASYLKKTHTPVSYNDKTRRVYFKRREKMTSHPILLLHFEHTLGASLRDSSNKTQRGLYLKSGAVKMLKQLAKRFQVVLFFQTTEKKE